MTHSGLDFFYRIFFSCYTTGKLSSEHNREVFKRCLGLGADVPFAKLQGQLIGWEERGSGIVEVAQGMGKAVIDEHVLQEYFGGSVHTEVILTDLAKDQVKPQSPFSRYTVLLHLLIPVVVEMVDVDKRVLDVAYRNEEIEVHLKNVLYLQADGNSIEVGKTVLTHFPLVVATDPSNETINRLLEKQRRDAYFMEACRFFSANGIDYARYYHFKMLQKRIA